MLDEKVCKPFTNFFFDMVEKEKKENEYKYYLHKDFSTEKNCVEICPDDYR